MKQKTTIAILIGIAFVVFVFGTLFLTKEKASITGFAVQSEQQQTIYCKGYNVDNIGSVQDLKPCVQYKDILLTEMGTAGLLEKGIDPLLIFSLAQQESSCNPQNARGLLQVDDCANGKLNCPDERSRIHEGLSIFNSYYSTLQSKGIKGNDLIVLTFFAYNRGIGTAQDAAMEMGAGKTVQEAMTDSCAVHFVNTPQACSGDYSSCRFDSRGNDKCTAPGYGAMYPQRIIDKFESYCKYLGGSVQQGVFSYKGIKLKTYGTYSIKPSFSVTRQHNPELYQTLKTFSQDTINACTTNVASCLDQQMQAFNTSHSDIALTQDCEQEIQKVYYQIVQNVQDCSRANHTTVCMCDLTKNINPQSKADYDLTFAKTSNENGKFQYVASLKGTEEKIPLETDYELAFENLSFTTTLNGDNSHSIVSSTPNIDGNLFLILNPYATTPEYFLGTWKENKFFDKDGPIVDPINETEICPFTQEYFKMCAITKETFPANENGNVVYEPLVIKFALYLKDNTPVIELPVENP